MEEGEIGHSGIHGSCPHGIKVFISKGPNRDYYKYLSEEAGDKPENPIKTLVTAEREET